MSRERKPFVPLVDRVHRTWLKVVVTLVGVALALALGAVIDKAMASPIRDDGWRPSHSRHLAVHTVKTWKRNRYGNYVPRYVRGHRICPRGHYLVQSKYTGFSCNSRKGDRKGSKALIKCAAYVLVGRYWGGLNGMKAAVAGCAIDWLL